MVERGTGFLVPSWYVRHPPDWLDSNLASIFFGFALAAACFGAAVAVRQTTRMWKRRRRVNGYVVMIWVEIAASTAIAFIIWFGLQGHIQPSFQYFFAIIFLWSIQVQMLLQIIINRIALLMVIPGRARKLKLVVFLILLAINISVCCIWIPARLQISDTFIHLNEIWDRVEKGVFLLVDAGLNLYFIYLVRSQLIAYGLTKYNRLYYANLVMIVISMSQDVIIIALMSLQNSLVYAQYHPVAYLIKLMIEMNMADLIVMLIGERGTQAANPAHQRRRKTKTRRGSSWGLGNILQGHPGNHADDGQPPELDITDQSNIRLEIQDIIDNHHRDSRSRPRTESDNTLINRDDDGKSQSSMMHTARGNWDVEAAGAF
ncbi:hypothetical protein GGR56DRAFT_251471 [Xylariaceae sp. FL0804]|nr:hypothetical protein GGR56DRAFT_251471 [Xylariaceae sp. FL0804]